MYAPMFVCMHALQGDGLTARLKMYTTREAVFKYFIKKLVKVCTPSRQNLRLLAFYVGLKNST